MTAVSTVDKSPHHDEIVHLLQSGWSAQRVHNYLRQRYPGTELGRAGKDKRVALSETHTMQLPEESFMEMLAMLRRKRERAEQIDPPSAPA